MDYSNLPSNNPQMLSVPGAVPQEETKPTRERQKAMFEVKSSQKHKSKFAEIFIKGSGSNIKEYIIKEALPNLGSWLFTNAIRAAECYFFGEARYGGGLSGNSYVKAQSQYVNYTQPKNAVSIKQTQQQTSNARFDFNDIVFVDTKKAAECLRKLDSIISEYGSVTVGDYLDLIGRIPGKTDWNYGWYDLSSVAIKPISDGAILIFPEPRPI